MRQVRRAAVLADICVHLPASACIWEVLSRQTSGAQSLYFVSFCFILFHLVASACKLPSAGDGGV